LRAVKSGASTPEELESLLEDSLLMGEGAPLVGLFDTGATIAIDGEAHEARGSEQIARLADELCIHGYGYLAGPRRVLQGADTALVVAEHAINVMRRAADRSWRYSISLLSFDNTRERSNR
jgi:hypothetical protein